ncbi:MAG: choice-of-anchor D domain-containing protein, partial [Bryobacteraceae bacterium]
SESKTVSYSSNPWMIGSTQPSYISEGYARTFNGIIDEVQAYSVALSQSQIQAIYNAGSAGVCKGLTFLPTSLKFARQTVGTTSAPLTATVTNAFALPVAIEHVSTKGDFAQTNACPVSPATLAPGADCSVSVTFTPTAPGTQTGWVAFVHNAPASPQIIGLSGAATDIGLSTAVLKFSHQVVGTSSIAQTVTVTNVGSTAVNFTGSGIVIAGADPADFVISGNTCGPSLAGESECTVGVEFAPTADGTRIATLQFNDSGGGSPQTVVLTGAASDVSLAPISVKFKSRPVGTTSAAHTVAVTNVGVATVNFTGSGIVLAGADPGDFVISSNICGASLAAGAECQVSVEFKPAVSGARSAWLQFNDDGGASPQTVVLYGSGT